MKRDELNLSKEEIRRRKRKKEQRKAFAILAGVLFVFFLLACAVVYGVITYTRMQDKEEVAETEPVVAVSEPDADTIADLEEPEEILPDPEPIIKTPSVSSNTISDNDTEETELSEEEKNRILDEEIKNRISGLTIEQKVAGLFFVTTEQLTNKKDLTVAGSDISNALNNYPVGGILLKDSNFESSDQLKDMTFNIRSLATNEIFVAVEEKGGEDGPFASKGLEEVKYEDQASIGETDDNSVAYSAGIEMGNRLCEYGFNTEIGPLTDMASSGGYTSSGSFGSDAETVRGMVRNMVRGLEDKEINVCPYFFPGYSDVTANPQSTRPVSSRKKEDIEDKEYLMYRDCVNSGVEFIMVSQIAYKNITGDDTPACFSSEFINDMLREDLGFEGIVMTDYLNTKSLVMHYKHADMPVMALKAGADMIFCPGDFKKAYNGVLDAVNSGEISEERIDEALTRIYRVKYRNLIDYRATAE